MDHEVNAAAHIPYKINENVSAVGLYSIDNTTEELNQLTAFIKRNCQDVRAVGKPFNANFVITEEVLINVMQFYYFRDDFEVEAVRLKDTIYLRKLNDEPGINQGLNVVELRTFGRFIILFNCKCNADEINELNDHRESAIIDVRRLNDSTDSALRRKMYFRWLLESDLGGLINSFYVERFYPNREIAEGVVISIDALREEAELNGRHLADCYTYLEKFLNQVNLDMNEVEDHERVFVYKFQRKLNDQEIGGNRNYIPTPEEKNQDNLSQDYVEFINNF